MALVVYSLIFRMDYIVAVFTRWKPNDCKASLLSSSKRAQLGRNKVLVQQRKTENDIAEYLEQGRDEKARIKAESLIHLQKLETAYDILETLIELLQTRIQHISESSSCPPDLVTPLASVIYATKRLVIPEFKTALRQFKAKFGAGFILSHQDNASGQVASNLIDALFISPPKEGEIHDLLVYIADKHNIEWIPPRKPETTAERNMEANPLKNSSAVAIAIPTIPAGDAKFASVPPPPNFEEDRQSANNLNNLVTLNSPVNDPQYKDLMDRLRRLKIDSPKGPENNDQKP